MARFARKRPNIYRLISDQSHQRVDNYKDTGKFTSEITTPIYFNIDDFNIENLGNSIKQHDFKPGVKYCFLLKIAGNDDQYRMAGKQVYFIYSNEDFDQKIAILYNDLNYSLNIALRKYFIGYEIKYIQLMFIIVRPFPELEIKNISKLKLNKDLVKLGETKRNFNDLFLPLSNNEYYGKKLDVVSDNIFKSNFLSIIKDQSQIMALRERKYTTFLY